MAKPKKAPSLAYKEIKFTKVKEANEYASKRHFTWYTSTLFLDKGVAGVKEFAPNKDILVGIIDDMYLIYYG